MRIKSFQVKGFRRLALANIRNLSATFTSPLQVILGRNGCGKSSVLKELSPMPADSNAYAPMGGKEVVIEHNGQEYIIKSINKSTMKHEFWCDGVQLNQGGTATVQRELVKRYFGLTPTILDLLNGTVTFQHMSVAKRRELFTELCPVDLSYALGVYNKLRTQYRDVIGARKHAEGRLASETSKLMPEEEYRALEAQVTLLQDELNVLMANRDLSQTNQELSDDYLSYLLDVIATKSKGVLGNGETVAKVGASYEEIDGQRIAVGKRIAATAALRDQMLEEYGHLEKKMAEIARTKGENKEGLKASLIELSSELAQIPQDSRFKYPDQIRMAIEEDGLDNLAMKVCDILTHMPDPTSGTGGFDRSSIEATRQEIESLEMQLIKLRDQSGRASIRIDTLETAKAETCPNCNHRFIVGMRPNELQQLGEFLDNAKVKATELETLLGEKKRLAEAQVAFEGALTEMRGYCRSFPLHRGLWDYMAERGFPFCSPRSLVSVVHQWKVALINEHRREQLKARIAEIEETIARLDAVDDQDVNNVSDRGHTLHAGIEEKTKLLEQLQQEERYWGDIATNFRLMSQNQTSVNVTKKEVADYLDGKLRELRNLAIERCIEGHHNQLGVLVNRLGQQKVAIGIVKDLDASVVSLKAQEVAYAKLLDELSPTDGLIAEQISGFIGCFVEKMNQILERIWTYPLRVLPCGLQDGELDYNFPIEMADERYTAPDVSCGSEAQRDVIDFAFKLTVGLYLKHTDWPLYLDELGASFDETHRSAVLAFVKDYVDMGKASQCFYISHYASTHAAMENAEICVIDGENIHVPRQHNKHVKIE